MKKGYLSQYFEGVAVKRLSSVEINIDASNQHELNGVSKIKSLLGSDDKRFDTKFLWIGGEDNCFSECGEVTWYDARRNHPTRSEYRLYFKNNSVMFQASKGDLLFLAKTRNDELIIVIAPEHSTFENQLLWLFNVEDPAFWLNYKTVDGKNDTELSFAVRYILEELEIEVELPDADRLDSIIEPYLETGFPSTAEFSRLARESVGQLDYINEPDVSIMKWLDEEEKLFKRLEKHIVYDRLKKGFYEDGVTDVEGFIQFSLSVQNRRKARAGRSIENHIEAMLKKHQVKYSRGAVTEHKSEPDFLFPGISYYNNESFPVSDLTMLGVKSTCKDRWRQVLAEARKIDEKHLFTIEPGISEHQTDEMAYNKLQLVIPKPLHETYKAAQCGWLMDFEFFLQLTKERQRKHYID